jgi:hypothetical protein
MPYAVSILIIGSLILKDLPHREAVCRIMEGGGEVGKNEIFFSSLFRRHVVGAFIAEQPPEQGHGSSKLKRPAKR